MYAHTLLNFNMALRTYANVNISKSFHWNFFCWLSIINKYSATATHTHTNIYSMTHNDICPLISLLNTLYSFLLFIYFFCYLQFSF